MPDYIQLGDASPVDGVFARENRLFLHLTISAPSVHPRRDSIGSRPTYVFDSTTKMFADLRSHALCHRRAGTRPALRSFVLVDAGPLTEWFKSRQGNDHRTFFAKPSSVLDDGAGGASRSDDGRECGHDPPFFAGVGTRPVRAIVRALRSCSGRRSACQGPGALISVIFDRTGPGRPGTGGF